LKENWKPFASAGEEVPERSLKNSWGSKKTVFLESEKTNPVVETESFDLRSEDFFGVKEISKGQKCLTKIEERA